MLTLTPEELLEVTGYKRYAEQRKWLKTRGWLFEVAAGGRPVVAREYAHQRLGVAPGKEPPAWKPDFSDLRA